MKSCLALSLFLTLVSQSAFASGFEKSVMWSGKYAGSGAAAVSGVNGSQSLYFNPAGLASPGDVSVNYSPTWIKVEGNLASTTKKEEADQGVLPFGGIFASYSFGKFGFGMGAYVAGGEKAIFNGVDLTVDSKNNSSISPDLKTDLEIMEYSLGGAMEVIPGLKLGAAWRISKVQGTLSSVVKATNNSFYSGLLIKDAKETKYTGFRLGAMFAPTEKWGVGASYRSKQKFDAPGTGSAVVQVIPTAGFVPQKVENTRVGLTFPSMLSLGGHYAINDQIKVMLGVDYANYSVNDNVYITGTSNGVNIGNIPLNWDDMYNYRLGMEYTGIQNVALRAGYVLTTQVTNSKNAKATLPPAGTGHLYAVGGGYSGIKNIDLDAALELSHSTGSGSMTMPTGTTKELLAGQTTESKANVVGIHTGVTYHF